MDGLLIIVVCLLLGIGLRRARVMPEDGARVLNKFVIYVSLPAMVLLHVHAMDFATIPLQDIMAPVSQPWLMFLGAWLLIHLIGKWRCWHPHTKACLILTAGLGNTSFVGFPLIQALYGAEGLQTAILLDQLGSFFVMSTLGIGIAIAYSGGQLQPKHLAKKLLSFPPFVCLVFALTTQAFAYPNGVIITLQALAATLVPLALTAVGMQLRVNMRALSDNRNQLISGLGYKLLLSPLIFYFVYYGFMDSDGTAFKVVVLEAAMAPMITAGIIATEYRLRGDLGALMIGIGIPASLVSVPLLNYLLW